MNWLKLFKKEKTYVDIDVLPVFKKFKKTELLCYGDLYDKSGIVEFINKIGKEDKLGKYHYKNIRASRKTIEYVENIMGDNIINTKNRFSKFYKKDYLKTRIAWDNFNFAPFTDNTIVYGKIRIILPKNKDFEKASVN